MNFQRDEFRFRRTEEALSGVAGIIMWHRLFDEALRASGEVRPHEEVCAFQVTPDGIQFFVRDRA